MLTISGPLTNERQQNAKTPREKRMNMRINITHSHPFPCARSELCSNTCRPGHVFAKNDGKKFDGANALDRKKFIVQAKCIHFSFKIVFFYAFVKWKKL
jgi:hypothetical protein